MFVPLLPDGRYATLMDEPIVFQGGHGHHRQSIKAGMEQWSLSLNAISGSIRISGTIFLNFGLTLPARKG